MRTPRQSTPATDTTRDPLSAFRLFQLLSSATRTASARFFMTTTERPPCRLSLHDESPTGARAFAFAALCVSDSFRGRAGRVYGLNLELGPLATGAGAPAPWVQEPWEMPFPATFCNDGWLSMPPHQRSETSWIC